MPVLSYAAKQTMQDLVRLELEKRYPDAVVQLDEVESAPAQAQVLKDIQGATLLQDSGMGVALFRIRDLLRDVEVHIKFSAWIEAPVAVRRIQPMEVLHEEDFKIQKINVAQGLFQPMRGLLVRSGFPLGGYESRQTILPGQPPLTSGIQRIADIKRGDVVQVKMVSNGVWVQTAGIAEEPGYRGQSIRVLIQKTKRQIQGEVLNSRNVEVEL